jgi:hypothetical protein
MAMDNVKRDLVSAGGNDLRDLLALRVEEIAQFTPSPIPTHEFNRGTARWSLALPKYAQIDATQKRQHK